MAQQEIKVRILSEEEREGLVATRDSQKLFRQALDTLPAEVTYWEMELSAPNIPHRHYLEELTPEAYVQRCKNNGIIPYSQLKLEWYRDCLSPKDERTTNLSSESSDLQREALVDALARGGKFANVEISQNHSTAGFERFKRFKARYLDTFLKEGYWISSANLWLSYYTSHEHYAEGDYQDGGLRLSDSGLGVGSLRFDRGYCLPEETVMSLLNWVGSLKGQYHDENLVELCNIPQGNF